MITISGQSITLANSIIGVGILAMPFCFKECGIILAIIILLISGLISRLSCYFLLKSALLCRRRNFESLAFHIFGPTGKFAVEISIIGFLLGTCIAYFVVVGDLGPQIIVKLFNLNHSDTLRTFVMVCLSVVCVLPLGLLKNVDSLSNFSAATICFYICLVFKVMVEATSHISTSEWVNQVEYWRTDGVLQCMPIFSMALFCQTQLFEIYESLPNASLDKMNFITKNAINVCTAVYILVGFFGYIAFYAKPISGNIIMEFSPTLASDAIKIGFVMSLAFSFPLIIFPCRASLYSLLYRKGQSTYHDVISNLIPEIRFRWITISIIAVSLVTGLLIPNIELVLGLVGSTIGVLISVIIPATCFICVSNKYTNERLLAQIILFAGVIIMVLGTYANLQAADSHQDFLDQYITSKNIKLNIDDGKVIIQNKINLHQGPLKDEESIFKNPLSANKENNIYNDKVMKESKVQPPVPIEPLEKDGGMQNPQVIKESKIQPPVPVPPLDLLESNIQKKVNGEVKQNKIDITENRKKVANIQTNDKSKDEISQLEQLPNLINDDNKLAVKEDLLHDNIKQDEKNLLEKAKELEQISDVVKNDEAIEKLKKEALIEQIKQHGQEQRELVEEQKEILKEIKKTKMEIDEEKIKSDVAKNVPVNEISVKKDEMKNENIKTLNISKNMEYETVNSKPKIIMEMNGPKATADDTVDGDKQIKIDNIQSENISEKHIHKNDEPNSYRLGEDHGEALVNSNVKIVPNNIDVMANYIPLPIAAALLRNNHSKDDIEEANAKNSLKDASASNEPSHLSGKRDILDVSRENEESNLIIYKRSLGDTPENSLNEKKSDNNILCNDDNAKQEFGGGLLDGIKMDALNLNNFLIHQSRNLKYIRENDNTG